MPENPAVPSAVIAVIDARGSARSSAFAKALAEEAIRQGLELAAQATARVPRYFRIMANGISVAYVRPKKDCVFVEYSLSSHHPASARAFGIDGEFGPSVGIRIEDEAGLGEAVRLMEDSARIPAGGAGPGKESFAIGVVMGGPGGHVGLTLAIAKLITIRDQMTPQLDDGVSVRVNVIYNVTGDTWPVRFTGIEVGAFSRARRLQAVQVAVPENLGDEAAEGFVAATMREAIDIADAAVRRRGLSVASARALVEATLRRLAD